MWALFFRCFSRFEIFSRSNRRRGADSKITMELVSPTILAFFVFRWSSAAPRGFATKRKRPRKQAPLKFLKAFLTASPNSKSRKVSEKQAPSKIWERSREARCELWRPCGGQKQAARVAFETGPKTSRNLQFVIPPCGVPQDGSQMEVLQAARIAFENGPKTARNLQF